MPQIYVANADGTNHIQLTDRPHVEDLAPQWSPDGTKILFSSYNHNNPNNPGSYVQIWVMNADGTELTVLTDNHDASSPSWSPDGSKIVYVTANDTYIMNADGSNKTKLARGTNPVWKPPLAQETN